ncbi:MAG TPA: CYTH domain-containing protein [Cytophagales bacterium]|jgi:CYTH domain-containing protein
MGVEIERKYLVQGTAWKAGATGVAYRQGYLSSHRERTVRIRTAGDKGYLTIKGVATGAARPEYEYEIPYAEAVEMLQNLCEQPVIEKVRYKIPYGGLLWEVDEFGGENQGLVVAEVELSDEGQAVPLPPWAGLEVTSDARYYNANLFRHPYSKWEQT